jgi:hypothetical protein
MPAFLDRPPSSAGLAKDIKDSMVLLLEHGIAPNTPDAIDAARLLPRNGVSTTHSRRISGA